MENDTVEHDTKPAWEKSASGDWTYWLGEGEERQRIGAVNFMERPGGGRDWFTVSTLMGHGPEAAKGLTAGKRRIEAMWAEREAKS